MQLNYKIYGSGQPLLIMHGLLGSLDNWHTLSNKWAADMQVFAVDLRNHGRSPHDDKHDYAVMSNDIHEFIRNNNLENVVLLGHSMGGKVAMRTVLEKPDNIAGIIVVDMAPRDYPSGHDEILEALESFPIEQVKSRKESDELLSKRIQNHAIRLFLLKNLDRDGDHYSWKMNLPAIIKNYDKITESGLLDNSYSGPALFIRGGVSPYIQDDDLPIIKKHFPEARLETIKGAGHWVHAEKPAEVYELVRNFMLN